MNTRSMLKAGEADVIPISGSKVKEVQEAGFRLIANPGAYYLLVGLGGQVLPTRAGYDAKSPWASDENPERSRMVREALCLAIDKQEIMERVLYGTATPFAVQQFYPTGPYVKADWKPYGSDPEKAKELLAKAGYPNGFGRPITMLINNEMSPEAAELAEVVAMYWEMIGLNVERRVIDAPVFRKEWYSRGPLQRMGAFILASTPLFDPLDWYALAADVNSSINQLFESGAMSALVAKALAETDPKLRDELRSQLGDMVYDNFMTCPIALQSAIYAVSDRVAGWKTNSSNKYLHNLEYIEASK